MSSKYTFYQRQFWSCVKVYFSLLRSYPPTITLPPPPLSLFLLLLPPSLILLPLQLLGNITLWSGLLAPDTLQEMVLDGLLNRYLVMALQNSPPSHLAITKTEAVSPP